MMTFSVTLLLTLCGITESCTEIAQVCYNCKGSSLSCSDGSAFATSPDGCVSHVLTSPTSKASYYYQDYELCKPYTCSNNFYFSDHSTRFAVRQTCNTDCSNFTLSRHLDSTVTTAALSSASKSSGQCFEDCFETIGCYAFSYGGGVCNIYTSCGTSCSMTSLSGTTSYTRSCHGGTQVVDCGALNNPSNGAVDTSSGTTNSNQAMYSCSTGYTLVGTSMRTCQSDGQWSGVEPVCNAKDCGTVTSPTNGAVNMSSGTTYNNKVIYTCLIGYTLVGTSMRTCQSGGQWSGGEPVCNAKDCGTVTSPTNGAVDMSSGTTYYNKVIYTCLIGYTLVGTSMRTCQSDGQWSGVEPVCNAKDCGTVTSPTNGAVDMSSGTTYNNKVIYTCSTGYTLVGTSTRTCQDDGQWSGSPPVCIADCGALVAPPTGDVDTPNGTTYSNKAVYTCSTGYVIVGNSSRICQSNGQWSASTPSCNIADCGHLNSPDNGYVQNPNNTTYLEQANFSCMAGFNLSGNNQRTCQSDGSWSGTSPNCTPVDCGIPLPPNNGAVLTNNGTTFGQNASFYCNTGYVLNGFAVATCNTDGFWGSSPHCNLIDCGLLTAPEYGTVMYSNGTTYGETAKFMCSAGHYLSHLNNRTCLSGGLWSTSTPTCIQDGMDIPVPVRLYIAPCICYSNKTFTGLSQTEIISYLIKETSIERNSTALARRKLISAKDLRLSSQIVGYTGAMIIAGALGVMFLADVLTCCRALIKMRRH